MALKLITAPTTEPITDTDVSAQIQGEIPFDQVEMVSRCISAVRQSAELQLNRAFVTQTWDLVLDSFPPPIQRNPFAELEIPLPPLQEVVSVEYLGADAQMHTMPSDDYQVDTDSTPGIVRPVYGKSWPLTLAYPGAVRIRFKAGYGTAEQVPACIKQWMLLNAATLYENRESTVISTGSVLELATVANALLDPERWKMKI